MRSRNQIKFLVVTVLAGVFAAAPAYATDPTNIDSFVSCLNSRATKTIVSAVACVPSDCYATLTVSPESAQPGCTLSDGTRLPRVLFSCPGPASSNTPALRFRPSFTLCTQPTNLINHIEVGEDLKRDPTDDFIANVMKMGDIDATQVLVEFTTSTTKGVVDTKTPLNNLGCNECHDSKGTVTSGVNKVSLFGAIPPALGDGTIFSNDPDPIVVHPATQTPLSTICAGIASDSKLLSTKNGPTALQLCDALATKTP